APTPVPAEASPPAVVWPPKVEPVGLPPIQRGPLVIDPGGFQLGTVLPGSAHETHGTIRNSGTAPVAIASARSTCMCTVPEGLEGAVIPPGGSHPFSVTYTAGHEPGSKDAKVWVKFQAGGEPQAAVIKIDALISMAVRSDPPYVDALKGVTSGQLRVESMDRRPFRILSAYGRPPAHADGFDPGRDEPRIASGPRTGGSSRPTTPSARCCPSRSATTARAPTACGGRGRRGGSSPSTWSTSGRRREASTWTWMSSCRSSAVARPCALLRSSR
ncbi:MAG: DUF1573 domain-containing protein, partial [Planctomycetota bacterium]